MVLTALLALVGVVFVTGVTANQIWVRSAPDRASRFWPIAGDTLAQRAALLVANPDPTISMREAAGELARTAIARNPTSVVAIRTRGLLDGFSGHDKAARRWMAYAEALSRRDLPTQLWSIEDAVGHGDIDRALVYYDQAMRTSLSAQDLLFPVLIGAVSESQVADKLARLLTRRPDWWGAFMNRLIGEVADPLVLVPFAQRLKLTPNDHGHPDFLSRILQRLVAAGRFAQADALYRQLGKARNRSFLQDGGFEGEEGVAPFAWRLIDDGDLSGRIENRLDGAPGQALFLDARNGRSGPVAIQALAIAPGRYSLRGQVGNVKTAPVIRIRCGTGGNEELAMITFPVTDAPRVVEGDFVVPAGCGGAWISIEANAGLGASGSEAAWIDNLALMRHSVTVLVKP